MDSGRLDTAAAVRILRRGGVLVMATDTVPGLHCRADDPCAVQRVIACKGRPEGKSLLVLAGSLQQARLVTGELSAKQTSACRNCWPGPFTLILPAAAGLLPEVAAIGGTIAVRVPGWVPLQELILAVGVPLVSTSANRAGQAPAMDLAAAAAVFGNEVDGVWGDERESSGPQMPSALVDLTSAPFAVLRVGPTAWPPRGRGTS